MFSFIYNHKKIILIFSAILVVIYVAGSLVRRQPTPTPVTPSRPTLQPGEVVDSLENIKLGETTEEEVLSILGNPIDEVILGDTKTLEYSSGYANYPHRIQVVDGIAVQTRKQISAAETNYKKISDFLPNPQTEPTIKYLRGYGETTPVYIYPADGVAFVAHASDQTVFEAWEFNPTDIQIGLATWGNDLVNAESVEVVF